MATKKQKNPNNIRELARAHNFKLNYVQEAAGISSTGNFYGLMEGRNPNMQDVYALCKVLQCDVRDIWPDNTRAVEQHVMIKKKVMRVERNG